MSGQLSIIGRMNSILEFLTIRELRQFAAVMPTNSLEARTELGVREDHFQLFAFFRPFRQSRMKATIGGFQRQTRKNRQS